MWHSTPTFNLNTGGQPGQCSEFQDIQDYIKRPCLRKQTKLFLYAGINIKFSGIGILRCTPPGSPHQCLQRGQPSHLPGGSHKDPGGKSHRHLQGAGPRLRQDFNFASIRSFLCSTGKSCSLLKTFSPVRKHQGLDFFLFFFEELPRFQMSWEKIPQIWKRQIYWGHGWSGLLRPSHSPTLHS